MVSKRLDGECGDSFEVRMCCSLDSVFVFFVFCWEFRIGFLLSEERRDGEIFFLEGSFVFSYGGEIEGM